MIKKSITLLMLIVYSSCFNYLHSSDTQNETNLQDQKETCKNARTWKRLKEPSPDEQSPTLKKPKLEGEFSGDGNYGFQDLTHSKENPVKVQNSPLNEICEDLWDIERDIKKSSKNKKYKTNFALGKLVFYYKNKKSSSYYLSPLLNNKHQKHLVFYSCSDKTKIEEDITINFDKWEFADQELDALKIMEFESHFPKTNTGNQLKEEREKLKEDIIQKLQEKNHRAKIYDECSNKYKDSLMNFHSNLQDKPKNEFNNSAQKLKDASTNFKTSKSSLIANFWHSEPRLLYFIKKNFLSSQVFNNTEVPEIIILFVHSTQDICNKCRVQFVGAAYEWLYKAMQEIKSNNEKSVLFHIVATWYDDYDKTKLKNIRDHNNITTESIATFEDMSNSLTSTTKPVVSFVKIQD